MAGSGREARRRRIIEGGQDRLALITGRKPNLSPERVLLDPSSSPPFDPPTSDPPSVSQNEEDQFSFITSSRDYSAAKMNQDEVLVGPSKQALAGPSKQPLARKSEIVNEPLRAPPSEDSRKGDQPSAVQRTAFTDAVLRVAQQIPISNVTSQQMRAAVAATEHDRMLCALTMAILVVLSYAGFPILGSRMIRWFILFRPLLLVLIANVTFIVRRLRPDNQRNLIRGDKDNNASLLGDGYAWAEEAGRALEVGLMLHNVTTALFLDCSVYAAIVVFGLSLFG